MKNRAWFKIHSFIGVVTGLLMFIICWSGSFAVISNELDWLVTPELRVKPAEEKASWAAIINAVKNRYPDAHINWISTPLYTQSAAQIRVDLSNQKWLWVYVDPYSAKVLGAYSYFNIQRFFRSFHRELFLPEVGYYLVTISSFTILTSLIAALMFYRRWWRRFFRWPSKLGRAFWSDLHKVVGLWSLWFTLLIGITGLWYLTERILNDFASSSETIISTVQKEHITTVESGIIKIDELLHKAKTLRPAIDLRSIFIEPNSLEIDGQADDLLVKDRANHIQLDRKTGNVLSNQTPDNYGMYLRLSDTADPLHFGYFGGLWTKVIWFVLGLLLSGIIFSGTYLHAQRLATKAGERYRWASTGAATGVTLLILIASVRFAFTEGLEYGPTINGVKYLPTLATGVKTVITCWVLLTVIIIGGWTWMLWRPALQQP